MLLENSEKNTAAKKNKNRAEIQKICPAMSKKDLILTNSNHVLAISINSPPSTGNKILAIFNFLYKQGLSRINLLMGDSIFRYTAMIKYGCSEADGRKIGAVETQKLIEYYPEHIGAQAPYSLRFIFTSDLAKEEDFKIIYEKLILLFKDDAVFRSSVENFSNYYFKRALESTALSRNQRNLNHEHAISYLLEELAISAMLNKKKFSVFIYPGVIQTMYDVITMGNPYLKELFDGYIFVSLRLNRKKN